MGKTRKKSKMKKYLSDKAIAALDAQDISKLRELKESGECLGKYDRCDNGLLNIAILDYNVAAHTRMVETFEYLLTLEEIDKNTPNSAGYTPLMYAFGYACGTSAFALRLIESGCELLSTPNGETPIHLAVQNHWPEVVELLIERGFDVDAQNDERKTALHEAALTKQTDMVWMLLFYGADPNATFVGTNSLGLTIYFTFFDIVFEDMTFLEQFSKFDKNMSLTSFIGLMCTGNDDFYKLMEIVGDINYNYDDLKTFMFLFYQLDSKMLEIFVREYGYIVEEVFQSCCLDDLFFCPDPRKLGVYIKNIFILLESDFISTVIEEINKSPLQLLSYLIQSFQLYPEKIDILTQILCCFLSYGANIEAMAMNEIHLTFGYCDLFKMMLHMNISRPGPAAAVRHPWPTVIYDVCMDLDDLVYNYSHSEINIEKLGKYFTVAALQHLRVPSLVELARNAARTYIVRSFEANNSMQFYTVLKNLKIAELHREIISFEQPIYS